MTIYKKGSKGEGVKQIQKALYNAGYPCGCIDGQFGALTEEAVRAFQKDKGLTVDGKVGAATMAKLAVANGLTLSVRKSKRSINEIIVHCSATPEGLDYTTDDIKSWHLKRGFSDIGYHYVIYRDGSIHAGRSIDVSGAHCENHNSHSIGICYIGGVEATKNSKGQIVAKKNKRDHPIAKDTRTEAQKQALLSLLVDLRKLYPKAKIHGHRDFAKKDCPSFDATNEYRNV